MAKQSFNYTKRGHKYIDKEVRDWEGQARVQIMEQLPEDFVPYDCPIVIKNLTFVFPLLANTPKYKKRFLKNGGNLYKKTRPDLMDNLPKNLFDACESVLFTDDSLIVKHIGEMKKIRGRKPRIEFEIFPLEQKIPK